MLLRKFDFSYSENSNYAFKLGSEGFSKNTQSSLCHPAKLQIQAVPAATLDNLLAFP